MDKNTIEKYYLVKQRINELEDKLSKYKEQIEKHMKNQGIKKMEVDGYVIKKNQVKNERINKKGCPIDIWEKYSSSSTYTSIEVKKMDKADEKKIISKKSV
jgi:hypothetical protein